MADSLVRKVYGVGYGRADREILERLLAGPLRFQDGATLTHVGSRSGRLRYDGQHKLDPFLRENFIERVFVHDRWCACEAEGTLAALVGFHTRHKLILMSHSTTRLRELGRIVATAKGRPPQAVRADYLERLMPALALLATPAKQANVLQHAMGYFKQRLGTAEKTDLLALIDAYRLGQVPLIAPVAVLRHLVARFDEPYLRGQYYLDPAPAELMLRNHV